MCVSLCDFVSSLWCRWVSCVFVSVGVMCLSMSLCLSFHVSVCVCVLLCLSMCMHPRIQPCWYLHEIRGVDSKSRVPWLIFFGVGCMTSCSLNVGTLLGGGELLWIFTVCYVYMLFATSLHCPSVAGPLVTSFGCCISCLRDSPPLW